MDDYKASHQTFARLMEGAKFAANISMKADLARRLNISGQRIQNWQARGVSDEGMLDAQELLGISAIWIRRGTGPKLIADPLGTRRTDEATGVYNLPELSGPTAIRRALETLRNALRGASDLDLIQVHALMGEMTKDPARGDEIIPRVVDLLKRDDDGGVAKTAAA